MNLVSNLTKEKVPVARKDIPRSLGQFDEEKFDLWGPSNFAALGQVSKGVEVGGSVGR